MWERLKHIFRIHTFQRISVLDGRWAVRMCRVCGAIKKEEPTSVLGL